ncbi:MAG: DUF2059 domain-containing protein [Burkholderiaceae bacterium]|nr:DUF2059 domain-containing protein [Burkholderiaceae bacterium]
MRRLAACLLLALSTSAWAQNGAPSDASIDTLLAVTKAESMLDGLYANLEQQMRQAMVQGVAASAQGKPLTAEQQRVLEAAPVKFARVMREELSWASIKPMQVQIYRESFTQAEIDGLIEFYRSPAGQAFVAKMPVVLNKSMQLMQQRMPAMMSRLQAAMQEVIAEAAKQ